MVVARTQVIFDEHVHNFFFLRIVANPVDRKQKIYVQRRKLGDYDGGGVGE